MNERTDILSGVEIFILGMKESLEQAKPKGMAGGILLFVKVGEEANYKARDGRGRE